MSKIYTFSKYHQNQFWHMLQDVKKYAEFESDVRLAWNGLFDDLLAICFVDILLILGVGGKGGAL